jgi:hypothetical protein
MGTWIYFVASMQSLLDLAHAKDLAPRSQCRNNIEALHPRSFNGLQLSRDPRQGAMVAAGDE